MAEIKGSVGIFLCVIFLTCQITTGSDVCHPDNRATNPQACFDAIIHKASNDSYFWFGKQFKETCTSPKVIPKCLDVRGGSPRTLMDLMFGNYSINTTTFDRFITIEYYSPAKTVLACGGSFVYVNKAFNVNPLVDEEIGSGYAQNTPTVRWETRPGELYTLIIFSAPANILHGFFININSSYNGSLDNEQALKPYLGLLNPSDRGNPYSFVLFKQSGYISAVSQEWMIKITLPFLTFTMVDAMDYLNLTDVLGMNWILATADAFSIGAFANLSGPNNCPALYEKVLPARYKPADEELYYYVGVKYSTPSLTFSECCNQRNYPASTTVPDSFSLDAYMQTALARTGYNPKILITERQLFSGVPYTKAGALFTLIMVDPDLQNRPEVGTTDRPLVHWLIVNAPIDDVTSGDEVLSYIGPMPPKGETHTYYFLLFGQSEVINATGLAEKYSGNCSESVKGRCLFKLAEMTLDKKLGVAVGANLFKAKSDDFVRYSYIQQGRDETVICDGVSGYTKPCSTSGSDRTRTSMAPLLCVIVAVLYYCQIFL